MAEDTRTLLEIVVPAPITDDQDGDIEGIAPLP
jgi:hypothetical protein